MRSASLVLLLLVTASMSGCIANMGELKEFLGVSEPKPLAMPKAPGLPPVAKAQVNSTLALVGSPLRFTSEGTKDPASLPLTYVWTLGDGTTARGESVVHAYARSGEYAVRLVVSNVEDLADQALLTVQVSPTNRAPLPVISVDPAPRGAMGASLTFDATGSRDPEGGALAYEWDFADGATSHEARASHAFGAPGRHAVKLTVTDPQGASASATTTVLIDGAWTKDGRFDLTGGDTQATPIVVAQGAVSLQISLTYDAGLGATNELVLVLKDASGSEVARATSQPVAPPDLPSTRTAKLALDAGTLAGRAAGAWSVEVVRVRAPAGAAWSLAVAETV